MAWQSRGMHSQGRFHECNVTVSKVFWDGNYLFATAQVKGCSTEIYAARNCFAEKSNGLWDRLMLSDEEWRQGKPGDVLWARLNLTTNEGRRPGTVYWYKKEQAE